MKRKSTDYVCFLKGLFADLGGLLVSFSLLVLVECFRRLKGRSYLGNKKLFLKRISPLLRGGG